MDEDGKVVIPLFIGLFAGFCFGCILTFILIHDKMWAEAVNKGYAVEIDSSLGKVYTWKNNK